MSQRSSLYTVTGCRRDRPVRREYASDCICRRYRGGRGQSARLRISAVEHPVGLTDQTNVQSRSMLTAARRTTVRDRSRTSKSETSSTTARTGLDSLRLRLSITLGEQHEATLPTFDVRSQYTHTLPYSNTRSLVLCSPPKYLDVRGTFDGSTDTPRFVNVGQPRPNPVIDMPFPRPDGRRGRDRTVDSS